MEQALAVIGGAFIGGSAMLCSGIVVEAYRRHKDRRAIALVIAGEISALTNERAQRRVAERLSRPEDAAGVSPIGGTQLASWTIDRLIDKVGLLGGDFPFRVSAYCAHLRECQAAFARMKAGGGATSASPHDARISWEDACSVGRGLMRDLLALSEEPFGIGRLNQRLTRRLSAVLRRRPRRSMHGGNSRTAI